MTWGMVISKEIDERKMDYRGSKSDYICKRATSGCFFIYILYVRCALVAMKVVLRRNISNLRLKITQ